MKETIVLIHGAFHGAWCWDVVAGNLRAEGYEIITPELDSANPEKRMDDHVDQLVVELDGRTGAHVVGHSRYADTVIRLASRQAIRSATLVAGGIKAATDQPAIMTAEPAKYGDGYLEAIIPQPDDPRLTRFDPVYARDFFYTDCTLDVVQHAISRLRIQNRDDESPPLATQPDVPTTYVICQRDRVLQAEWQEFMAKNILPEASLVKINSGHSPFFSHPDVLTGIIMSSAAIN